MYEGSRQIHLPGIKAEGAERLQKVSTDGREPETAVSGPGGSGFVAAPVAGMPVVALCYVTLTSAIALLPSRGGARGQECHTQDPPPRDGSVPRGRRALAERSAPRARGPCGLAAFPRGRSSARVLTGPGVGGRARTRTSETSGSGYQPAVVGRLRVHCLSHLVRSRGAATQRRPSARPAAGREPPVLSGTGSGAASRPSFRSSSESAPSSRCSDSGLRGPSPPGAGGRARSCAGSARRTGTRPAPPPGREGGEPGEGAGSEGGGTSAGQSPSSCLPGLGVGTPGARSHGRARAGSGGAAGDQPVALGEVGASLRAPGRWVLSPHPPASSLWAAPQVTPGPRAATRVCLRLPEGTGVPALGPGGQPREWHCGHTCEVHSAPR